MRVLAIDPGMECGWAIVDINGDEKIVINFGIIRPSKYKTKPKTHERFYETLDHIHFIGAQLWHIMHEYKPTKVIMEALNLQFVRKSHGRAVNWRPLMLYAALWGYLDSTIFGFVEGESDDENFKYGYVELKAPKKKVAQNMARQIISKQKLHLKKKSLPHHVAEALVWAYDSPE